MALLLAKGADPAARDKRGQTPADLAASSGHMELALLLREKEKEQRSMARRQLAVSLALLSSLSGPTAAGEARPEDSPAACAVAVARTVSNPNDVGFLTGMLKHFRPEQGELAAPLLTHVLELATRKPTWWNVTRVAVECARLGRRDEAVEFMARAPEPEHTLAVATALARLGDLDQAVHVARAAGEGYPLVVARKWLEAGRKHRALDILALARIATGGNERTAGTVAVAYAEAGETDQAIALAVRIPNTLHPLTSSGEAKFFPARFKLMAFTHIAHVCMAAGAQAKAREALAAIAAAAK